MAFKMTKFEKERIQQIRKEDIQNHTIFLYETYRKIYPKWFMSLNTFLYKKKFPRLALWLTRMYGVRTKYSSSYPIKVDVYRWGKLVARNY